MMLFYCMAGFVAVAAASYTYAVRTAQADPFDDSDLEVVETGTSPSTPHPRQAPSHSFASPSPADRPL